MTLASASPLRVTLPDAARGTTAANAVTRPHHVGRRRQGSVAGQIREQRRGYARAVLQGVARTHRGRPASGVATILRQSLTSLGVRLPPARLRELAAQIEAGQPVELA